MASPLVFIGSGPPLVCHDHLHCTPSATEIPITTNLPRLKLLTEDYTDSLECRDTVLEFNSSGASFLCQVSAGILIKPGTQCSIVCTIRGGSWA